MNTRELTQEEQEALTKDLTEVLEKHNADLGVVARIEILKRVEEPKESPESEVVSPYADGESNDNTNKETDSETESSG